jgi:hypothetical protein
MEFIHFSVPVSGALIYARHSIQERHSFLRAALAQAIAENAGIKPVSSAMLVLLCPQARGANSASLLHEDNQQKGSHFEPGSRARTKKSKKNPKAKKHVHSLKRSGDAASSKSVLRVCAKMRSQPCEILCGYRIIL